MDTVYVMFTGVQGPKIEIPPGIEKKISSTERKKEAQEEQVKETR